jgi:hypothetical protein
LKELPDNGGFVLVLNKIEGRLTLDALEALNISADISEAINE